MVGLGDGTRLLLITFACIAQARHRVEKRSAFPWAGPQPAYYKGGGAPSYKAGGEELDEGFKFTDDTITSGLDKDSDHGMYKISDNEIDIPHVDLEEHQASQEFGQGSIGTGFHDIGPKDVGQEIFAKMEEAAQHAMAIVEGAKKFTEEAVKEQEIKGNPDQAYKEQLALSPNDVHVDSTYPAAPAQAPPAAPPAAPPGAPPAEPPAAPPAEPAQPPPPAEPAQSPPPAAGWPQ